MTQRTTTALIVGCGAIGRHHGVVLTRDQSFTATTIDEVS